MEFDSNFLQEHREDSEKFVHDVYMHLAYSVADDLSLDENIYLEWALKYYPDSIDALVFEFDENLFVLDFELPYEEHESVNIDFIDFPKHTKEYLRCKEIISQVEKINPDFEYLQDMKYRFFKAGGDEMEMVKCINKILETKPASSEMLHDLAEPVPGMENYNYAGETILMCMRKISALEFNKIGHNTFGLLVGNMKKYNMIDKMINVISKYGDSYNVQVSDVYKFIGISFMEKKQFEKSIEWFSKAIIRFDENKFSINFEPEEYVYVDDYKYFGRDYKMFGIEDIIKSILDYKFLVNLVKAAEIKSDDLPKRIDVARIYRGLCYYLLGQFDEAYKDFGFDEKCLKEGLPGKYDIDFSLRCYIAFFNQNYVEKLKSHYADAETVINYLN